MSSIIPDFWMPENAAGAPTITGGVTLDLTAANDYAAFIFSMPETKEISRIYFNLFSVTTANKTVQVRLESVVNGVPSGTLLPGSSTSPTLTIAVTANPVAYSVVFSSAFTVTAGTLVAFVIKVITATTGSIQLSVYSDGMSSSGMPYVVENNSGTANPRFVLSPLIGLGNPTETLRLRNAWPISAVGADSMASSAVRANKIKSYGDSYRVRGIKFWASAATNSAVTALLFDEAGTLLASASVPPESTLTNHIREVYFSSPVTVSSDYYVGIVNSTATSVSCYYEEVSAAQFRSGSPFSGPHVIGGFSATINNPTIFTEVSLRTYYIAPIITSVEYADIPVTTVKTFSV